MDVFAIRKHRLRALADRHFDGKLRALADAAGMKPEQMYRWLTKNPAADTRRVTEDSAREIESRLGLIAGSLDDSSSDAPFYARDAAHSESMKPAAIPLSTDSKRTAEPAPFQALGKTAWPFEMVDPARYYALSEAGRQEVQQRMNEAIALCEIGMFQRDAQTKRPA